MLDRAGCRKGGEMDDGWRAVWKDRGRDIIPPDPCQDSGDE